MEKRILRFQKACLRLKTIKEPFWLLQSRAKQKLISIEPEQARIRAEKRLNEKKEYEDGLDLKRAQLALMRSLSRLRLKK
ncbi:hypothetical protein MX850_04155 [Erysipelothrix sp. Poltava]|nr:hypothetical protein MX850_04155 [Erysipelothrix sp. Poltava]